MTELFTTFFTHPFFSSKFFCGLIGSIVGLSIVQIYYLWEEAQNKSKSTYRGEH